MWDIVRHQRRTRSMFHDNDRLRSVEMLALMRMQPIGNPKDLTWILMMRSKRLSRMWV